MEGVAVNVGRGLRGYWARRGYQRLGNGGRGAPADQAGKSRRRRIRWRRVKVAPRIKLMKLIVRSPKRFLIWLRDAYVKMMTGFATSPVCRTGYGGSVAGPGVGSFGTAPLKEYDQRVIIEIYKSLMVAHGQLVPRDAGHPASASRFAGGDNQNGEEKKDSSRIGFRPDSQPPPPGICAEIPAGGSRRAGGGTDMESIR